MKCPKCDTPLCLKLAEPVSAYSWVVKSQITKQYLTPSLSFSSMPNAKIMTQAEAVDQCRSPNMSAIPVQFTANGWQEVQNEPKGEPVAPKVIHWQEGDWWSYIPKLEQTTQYQNRGDQSLCIHDFDGAWFKRCDSMHKRMADSEGDARAAELGYTVKRDIAPPTPKESVYPKFLNGNDAASVAEALTRRIEALETELARQQDRVRKLENKGAKE